MSIVLNITDVVSVIAGIYVLLLEYGILPSRLSIKGHRPTRLMKACGFIILFNGAHGLVKAWFI